jgi:hypothetical protein
MRFEHPRAQEFLRDFGRVLEGMTRATPPSDDNWMGHPIPLNTGVLPIVASCRVLRGLRAGHLVEATFAGHRWGYALEVTFFPEPPHFDVVRPVSMFGDIEALENDLMAALLTV